MDWKTYAIYVLVMAGVTYLIRMIPLVAVRGKIQSRFIRSFLYYVPYAVLSAMTFPAIFESTGSLVASIAGTVAATILGWFNKSLTLVAVVACAVAYLMPVLAGLLGIAL